MIYMFIDYIVFCLLRLKKLFVGRGFEKNFEYKGVVLGRENGY